MTLELVIHTYPGSYAGHFNVTLRGTHNGKTYNDVTVGSNTAPGFIGKALSFFFPVGEIRREDRYLDPNIEPNRLGYTVPVDPAYAVIFETLHQRFSQVGPDQVLEQRNWDPFAYTSEGVHCVEFADDISQSLGIRILDHVPMDILIETDAGRQYVTHEFEKAFEQSFLESKHRINFKASMWLAAKLVSNDPSVSVMDSAMMTDVAENLKSEIRTGSGNLLNLYKKTRSFLQGKGIKITLGESENIILPTGFKLDENGGIIRADGTPLTSVDEERLAQALSEGQSDEDVGTLCFGAGTSVELPCGDQKPIELLKVGDKVRAFSGLDGDRRSGKVTQLHRTENQEVILFHGIEVTPGHVFLSGDGSFRKLCDILALDGTVVDKDGVEIRARTGLPVGGDADRVIPVGYMDGDKLAVTTMRAGSVYGELNGRRFTILEMMHARGFHLCGDGRFINIDGEVVTAFWEWGAPEEGMISG